MIARSLLLLGSCLIVLNACTSTPVGRNTPLPELTFAHLMPIPVQVADIEFIMETRRGSKPWDISNDLPTTPDVAMQRYLEQRYKAVGANGVLQVELKKADISYKSSPQDNSLLKYIPIANEDEFAFEIIVDVATKYLSGRPEKTATLRFVRVEKLAPQVTPAYREARLQRVLEEIIRDIDQAMINEFAHVFNIVRDRDIPVRSMDIKSEEPEMETIFSRKSSASVAPETGNKKDQ